MNTVLQAYRQQNPNDQRPDDVLNILLAEQAPDLLEQFPDFAAEHRAIRRTMAPSLWDEFKGSFGSAVDNLQSTAFGAGALASDLVGADTAKNYMLRKAQEQAAEASSYQPTVASYRDIETPGDLASYIAYGAGQVAPSAAESAAFALAGGGIGGLIARQGVKGATEAAISAAVREGVRRGSMAGLAAATIPQSQGEIYTDIADQPGAAGIAAVAGTFSGLLDMIPEGYVLGKFFKPGDVVEEPVKRGVMEYVKRLGLEAAKTMPMEGSTEAAQEFIGIAAGKYARGENPTLTDQDVERMLNAGIIGVIGGAMFAPVAAIGESRARNAAPVEREEIEPVITPKTVEADFGDPFSAAASAPIQDRFSDEAVGGMAAPPADMSGQPVGRFDNVRELSDIQTSEAPSELDYIAKVQEAVAAAAEAARNSQIADDSMAEQEAAALQQLARNMAGTIPDDMLPPMVARSTPDPREFGVMPQAVEPTELQFIAPPRDPMQPTAVAPDPREFAPLAALPSAESLSAPSPQAARPAPSIVAQPEPVAPIALSAQADQALASTREIEDFRTNEYSDPLSRIRKVREDAHAKDGLQRAVLLLDRATGQLFQRGLRDKGENGLLVDAAARPAPKGHGRGQGRVLDIDLISAESGARLDRVLKERMADGSDRYEIAGFSVLENGAAKNLNLGDANAYFAAPQFNERKAARLVRKQQQDMRSETRQVKRNRKVVSMAENAAETGQPGAVESAVGGVTPVSAEGRLAAFIGDLVEMKREGATNAELRKRAEQELKSQRKDISSAELSALTDFIVNKHLPQVEDTLKTVRTKLPQSVRLNSSDAVGLFQSVVRSIRETGGDVALFEQQLTSEFEAVRKAYGIQTTTAEGRSLIAIGTDTIQNPANTDNLVKLLHEAGHHFVKQLPIEMQAAFHDALDRAHWSEQRWLLNPLSLDIRLLANSPRGALSPVQLGALEKLTSAEIDRLRQTPPDLLLVEQGAEHLAMLGMDRAQARGLMQSVIRFVKDMLLRMGMAIQRTLKGEQAVSDRLVRAYVENRWLQFVNRDFSLARDAALNFRNFIGAPATFRETVQTFSYLDSTDPRVGNIDLATGRWYPGLIRVDSTDTLRADLITAMAMAEAGVASLTSRGTVDPKEDYTRMQNAGMQNAATGTVRGRSVGSINYTPEVTFNRDAAVINFLDTTYRDAFKNPDVTRLLPQEVTTSGNPYGTFLRDYIGLNLGNNPQKMMEDLRAAAANAKDPQTGEQVDLNYRITISELPKLIEQRTGADGNTSLVEVSSAQDSAMRSVLATLDSTVSRMGNRIAEDEAWLERARARKSLFDEDRAKVLKLDARTALAKKILGLIRAEQKRLEFKLERSAQQHFYPGTDYIVPLATDAKGEAAFATKKLPLDLSFSPAAEKEFVGNLNAMRAWLDNPANREQGSLYVQVQRQYKALNEDFTTRYVVQRSNRLVRKTFGRSLVEILKLIGTPSSMHAARRIIQFQNWVYRYEADAKELGAQWSEAYHDFAAALGKKTNESFDETVWDSFMRAGEQVNETDTQARERIAAVLRNVHGISVDKANKKVWSAFGQLIDLTKKNQAWERSIFEAMGLKVKDPTLGDKAVRRLVQIGYLNGRRSASKLVDSLLIRMNPVWSETGDTAFLNNVEQVAGNPQSLRTQLDAYFTEPIIRDFVEPLVRNNASFITLRDQGPLTPFDVRMAWEKSDGDMLAFIQRIHETTNPGGDFTKTAADVMAGFSRMFGEVKMDAQRRKDTQLASTETTPRQMMDARQADNWPAEWVSYAKYDTSSNYTILMQLAIQAGIGDGGFGPNGEFHSLIGRSLVDVETIRTEFNDLVRQGLTPEQIKTKIGADRYEKAEHAEDYRWLLRDFTKNAMALTKTTGYQIGDAKVMIQFMGLISSMTLQQPKSALGQAFDPFIAPFWRVKFGPTALKMVQQGFKSMFAEGANALGANGLAEWARNGDMVQRRLRAGIKDADAYVSYRQKAADTAVRYGAPDGPESFAALVNRKATQVIADARDVMNVGVTAGKGATKFRPLGIFNSVSQAINNAFFDQVYNSVSDLAIRGIEFIERTGGAETARKMASGEIRLTPEALGYTRSWLVLNDKPAFDYLADSVVSKMGERSLEDFIVKAWQRKQAAQGAAYEVIDNRQLMGVVTMAMSDMSLHADAVNAPLALQNSPFLRMFSTFLVWPWLQMVRSTKVFQTIEGRYTAESALDGLTVVMIGAIPATLAASLVADLYDEKITGKRSNLRELPTKALIPGVALAYPAAALERLARYGAFGLASEAVNGMLNQDDARGGFSADNRVFLLNQFQNVRSIVGNLYQQEGNISYQSVGRPVLQLLGMNGPLQYWQIANNQLGLKNAESEVNARINASNYLRATGRALDLDVRTARGSGSLPTPITPYLQQMELGALNGDTSLFNYGFARAVQEAADAGKDDPVKYVKQAFADRHPLRRIFRTLPSQTEYRRMLAEMDDYGRTSVSRAVMSYNGYLQRLGLSPITGMDNAKAAANDRAKTMSLGDARLAAAMASYGVALPSP